MFDALKAIFLFKNPKWNHDLDFRLFCIVCGIMVWFGIVVILVDFILKRI